jgi:hypothetical protein
MKVQAVGEDGVADRSGILSIAASTPFGFKAHALTFLAEAKTVSNMVSSKQAVAQLIFEFN